MNPFTMNILSNRIDRKAFIISFLYVGIGTFSLLTDYPGYPLGFLCGRGWLIPLPLFTLPVTIISLGYSFYQYSPLYPIFVIQAVMLIPTYLVVRRIMLYFNQ